MFARMGRGEFLSGMETFLRKTRLFSGSGKVWRRSSRRGGVSTWVSAILSVYWGKYLGIVCLSIIAKFVLESLGNNITKRKMRFTTVSASIRPPTDCLRATGSWEVKAGPVGAGNAV